MDEKRKIGREIGYLTYLFRDTVRKKANDAGIGTTCFHILNVLAYAEEENISQKDICEWVKMKAPTISLTLQDMEKENYIYRVKDEKDARKTFVKLTKKGKEKANEINRIFSETDSLLESSLTKEELELFYSSLNKMKIRLKEVNSND